jgi:hypothetical protein
MQPSNLFGQNYLEPPPFWSVISQRFSSDISGFLEKSESEDVLQRIMVSKWETKKIFFLQSSRTH